MSQKLELRGQEKGKFLSVPIVHLEKNYQFLIKESKNRAKLLVGRSKQIFKKSKGR
jgi:hypothetical protein